MTILTDKFKFIHSREGSNRTKLCDSNNILPIVVSESDGVEVVAQNLANDFYSVTGFKPKLLKELNSESPAIFVGTIGKSIKVDSLLTNIEKEAIIGKWDSFIIKTLKDSIVIVGSNIRGTIYGMYEISKSIGVSPLHWWADVPCKKHKSLFLDNGIYYSGEPKIKYRGFFINDEYPCLGELAHDKFGGFTSKFYIHVFDLLLRLKGNYFWPAMWADCFYDDDPQNHTLADSFGIVMGTSHHEPMMRSWKEWERYGKGEWDLDKNPEVIKQFWKDGISRMGEKNSLVTVGMRGDGDEPLTEDDQVELLKRIIDTQSKILEETTGKQAEDIPQMWAVYKEVQEAYEKGLRVPEHIITMLCDDNWGNLRILPSPTEVKNGKFGLYYHFDYVGGPRNYKWINTSPIIRSWEQLSMAYTNGIKDLWIVNVGDIKPLEFPLTFFMDFAWNPENWDKDEMELYTELWAENQFSKKYSKEIADLIRSYSKINASVKPELFKEETYSIENYNEFETQTNSYEALEHRCLELKSTISKELLPAYYQLVEYPIISCANLYKMYYKTALNHQYFEQKRVSTNKIRNQVIDHFNKDFQIRDEYNSMLNGKWNHMASQNHISYTYWQQPEEDVLPNLFKLEIPEGKQGEPGIYTENGIQKIYRYGKQSYYIEIYNKGTTPLDIKLISDKDWVKISSLSVSVIDQIRVFISVDWSNLRHSDSSIVTIYCKNSSYSINIEAIYQNVPASLPKNTYIEADGYISMEAKNFCCRHSANEYSWEVINDLGKTDSGITVFPQKQIVNPQSKFLATVGYSFYSIESGIYNIELYISPLNPIIQGEDLQIAVSIDDSEIEVITIHKNFDWDDVAGNSIQKLKTRLPLMDSGLHKLKIHMINIGVVLQKITLAKDELPYSYLGPIESHFI